jgi:hypothetical protein
MKQIVTQAIHKYIKKGLLSQITFNCESLSIIRYAFLREVDYMLGYIYFIVEKE